LAETLHSSNSRGGRRLANESVGQPPSVFCPSNTMIVVKRLVMRVVPVHHDRMRLSLVDAALGGCNLNRARANSMPSCSSHHEISPSQRMGHHHSVEVRLCGLQPIQTKVRYVTESRVNRVSLQLQGGERDEGSQGPKGGGLFKASETKTVLFPPASSEKS
jgi:hypothetical protein